MDCAGSTWPGLEGCLPRTKEWSPKQAPGALQRAEAEGGAVVSTAGPDLGSRSVFLTARHNALGVVYAGLGACPGLSRDGVDSVPAGRTTVVGVSLSYRQWTSLGAVLVASIALATGYVLGRMAPAVIFVAIQALALTALLWATRRSVGDAHVAHAVAHAAASDGDVIVYWQPD